MLIVDDQLPFRLAARAVLRRTEGFELVGEAADGDEAVELVGELRPDLVLMDINMPRHQRHRGDPPDRRPGPRHHGVPLLHVPASGPAPRGGELRVRGLREQGGAGSRPPPAALGRADEPAELLRPEALGGALGGGPTGGDRRRDQGDDHGPDHRQQQAAPTGSEASDSTKAPDAVSRHRVAPTARPTGRPTSTPMATMARDITTTETRGLPAREAQGSQHGQVPSAAPDRHDQRVGQGQHGDRADDRGHARGQPAELLEVLDRHRDRLGIGLEPGRQQLGELVDVLARARPRPPRR